MKTKVCYWCGKPSTSMEHVPPRGFFPKGKRESLFKVPACNDHNEGLSKLDERFRFYLQACADNSLATEEFRNKTFRGIKRPESQGLLHGLAKSSRLALLSGQKSIAFEVNPTECNLFFEKILRALFFHHYGEIFVGCVDSVCTHIHSPGFDIRPTISTFVSLRPDLEFGDARNPDVFRYECGRVTENELTAFAMICTFYENVTVFGLGTPKET